MAGEAAIDAAYARALVLGAAGLGTTKPNPSVGCVILDRGGRPVGEGATAPPGGRHAEITALAGAGDKARGGTAVVTLEPCAHTGRTGPCTEALIEAGVRHVAFGEVDPNREAAGGAAKLIAAGISVRRLGTRADYLLPWLTATSRGWPFVTWKSAATLDGRTAAPDGTSRWITGPRARHEVHELRARVDAVLVGSSTVLADDPALTVRIDGETRQPLRVVADRRGRTPVSAQVNDDSAETFISHAVQPAELLAELHERGVRHVLLEGGATLAGAFADAGLIDEVIAYVAPKLLGAGTAVIATMAHTLTDALELDITDVTLVGNDVRITARKTHDTGGVAATTRER